MNNYILIYITIHMFCITCNSLIFLFVEFKLKNCSVYLSCQKIITLLLLSPILLPVIVYKLINLLIEEESFKNEQN